MPALLFGLNASGKVVHTEVLERHEESSPRVLAEQRLSLFHAVEIWIESVRVVRLTRDRPQP